MKIHILGYGPITEALFIELSKSNDVDIYSDLSSHSSRLVTKSYEDFLGLELKHNDIFVLAWRELPIPGDLKYLVLKRLEKVSTPQNLLVYLSSVAVYGQNYNTCFETTSLSPINRYGKSKLDLEDFLGRFSNANLRILRISNVFGHKDFDDVLNRTIKAAIDGRSIELIDPSLIYRDFISIENVVKGVISVVSEHIGNSICEIYNVSSGHSISLLDLINIIEDNLGKNVEVIKLEQSSQIIVRSLISNRKFLNLVKSKNQNDHTLLESYVRSFVS